MKQNFSQRLVSWQKNYGRHHLPWQNTSDAYRVWLSEVMLQQTQVATVIDYYNRFLSEFPTVFDLACASQEQVLALWQGLGYYSRARNLHACAQQVVSEFGGCFPDSVEQLESLPGIGRSTAGAVASLAYGKRAAILDGNVKRVLCRHAGVEGYPEQAAVKKKLWALAEALLPVERVGQYNQALMDLGASICLAKKPLCSQCPVQATCVGFQQNVWSKLPTPKPKQEKPTLYYWVLMVFDENQNLLMRLQEATNLWKGLWMPPLIPIEDATDGVDALKTQLLDFNLPLVSHTQLKTYVKQNWLKHELTHRRLRFKCLPVRYQPDLREPIKYSFGAAGKRPVPKLVLKLLDHTNQLMNN